MAEVAGPDRLRLFFALWPAADVRCQLADTVAAGISGAQPAAVGQPVPAANYHVTLAFLGSVAAADLPAMQAVARHIRLRCFDLYLAQTGYWPRSRIAWLGPADCPAELTALVEDLWIGLSALGIKREQRPYQPHVTLARKATGWPAVQLELPIRWPVTDFALVESVTTPEGSVYRLLEQYPAGA